MMHVQAYDACAPAEKQPIRTKLSMNDLASLVSGVLLSSDAQVVGVLVVRGLARGDDLPEVGGLELVGLGESGNCSLQEVTLGSSRTIGLGCLFSDPFLPFPLKLPGF